MRESRERFIDKQSKDDLIVVQWNAVFRKGGYIVDRLIKNKFKIYTLLRPVDQKSNQLGMTELVAPHHRDIQ